MFVRNDSQGWGSGEYKDIFLIDIDHLTWSVGKKGRKEMFYLTIHSTHFIYGYMASDIW